ncbi:bifunctional aspartate kinase/homoserine dehydrogenase I [Buchnera aphidicola (Pemphigus obesinymphae)]|uniref:bifunctional aspartate kinase/homoserine dehydrogenase I n=1 Tax=Buchnera aphidicola TaxID=9 RepID=UPI002238AE5B|nr:bifunctional aspartate kinase/homoserine dehydrogenase I [Buchnera aphidicola]MCW5196648.1 bifunctional aspartate kinase/homoserine dehydrogenase I [Buchnera aphidicola (Pemphigus obesinymphae)]
MRILKFGGTSLANAERFLHVANIIENKIKYEQIGIVLSAPATVTNCLIKIIEKTIKQENIESYVHETKHIFLKILKEINLLQNKFPYKKLKIIIDEEFIKLKKIFYGIHLLSQCPDNIYANIICRGEILSVIIMKGILESRNYKITIIDPVKNLLGIGNYMESEIDIIESSKRINAMNIPNDHIILMSGFIAGNKKGELVVLGRNGSDYSASILSSCLNANYCEIWTDVDGIYTCDPKKVPDAKLLTSLTYQEAIELSYFGAKVLHPRTISPIAKLKIPCLIKNTSKPSAMGTLICAENKEKKENIKGITYLNNISMFHIVGPGMENASEITARIFSVISYNKIWVMLTTQSSAENSINFCIPQKNIMRVESILKNEFHLELKNGLLNSFNIIKNLSIVSIISSDIQNKPHISAYFLSALANAKINIVAIAQGSSKNSISVVISNSHLTNAIKTTHQVLFNKNQIIEIFLIGIGGIGNTLLQQIYHQKNWLKEKKIDLKICGIANSKKLLINMQGIPLENWKKYFENTKNSFTVKKIINIIKEYPLINPVLIDCTADEHLSYQYTNFLSNGFHVVTSNKKANTTDLSYYKKIRNIAVKFKKKFLYDTNVGAGLPVIDNLQNLLNSGDTLIHFRGILSGSLSFIFGQLEEGIPLSQATQNAKEIGFTEPDPRDDLSGIDVARKLLILAREVGYEIELKDIKIENLLPDTFQDIPNVKNFMEKLKELDPLFSVRVRQEKNKGKVLRFVGIIDPIGQCQVKIEAVDKEDPLYTIKNGENALAFYSKYYQPIPLVLRGYGAGNNVTAAGVFSDILRTLPCKSGV